MIEIGAWSKTSSSAAWPAIAALRRDVAEEPRSKIDGRPPVFRETEHLFLDLPAFGKFIGQGSSVDFGRLAQLFPLHQQKSAWLMPYGMD